MKNRLPVKTNYSEAWQAFTLTQRFKDCIRAMGAAGVEHPYRENILMVAFEEGWNRSGVEIKVIDP